MQLKHHLIISLFAGLLSLNAWSKSAPDAVPEESLILFTQVLDQIKSNYVEPVQDPKLFEDAIQGMLSGLDPHSAYLDKESFEELTVNTSGQFGGLGIEVTMHDGFVKVVSPIDDTPATKAGVQPGDLIVKIDDTPVKGLTLAAAVERMRGPKGSPIWLTIVREGADAPLKLKLVRDTIKVKSVRSEIVEPGYAYLRLSQFQADTAEEMKQNIQTLKKQSKEPLKGLILDLRNNPGGILESAVEVSNTFLDGPYLNYNGLIVYTEGRNQSARLKEYARAGDMLEGTPLVILVNGGSASAAEIVAGALQDHRRAIIMGERTFGKGSVQTVLPLGHDTALKLTTALYYTPSGRSIQAEGIVPDISLARLTLTPTNQNPLSTPIREADLDRHLANKKNGPNNPNTMSNQDTSTTDASDAQTNDQTNASHSAKNTQLVKPLDYPVTEALNLLKGLQITLNQTREYTSTPTPKP